MLGSRAAAEAGPAAISSLSTTMPFLYQTKTLSHWTLTVANMAHQARYCNSIFRRRYGDLRISRVPVREARIPKLLKSGNRSSPSSKSTQVLRITDTQPFPASWSLGPQTSSDRAAEGLELEASDLDMDDGMGFSEDSALEDEIHNVDPFAPVQPTEIQDLTRKHGARDSTITESERAAFQKIFADIFKRSSANLESGSSPNTLDDPFVRDTMPRDMQEAKQNLGEILTSAMQRQPSSRAAMEVALDKYPPALRAAAATAMGYIEDEKEFERTRPNQSAILEMKELEALREPERKRVEGLMNAASTDFELLEVMEKEVFSLIPKLGLDGDVRKLANAQAVTPSTPKSNKPVGWKKAERALKRAKGKPADLQPEQMKEPETIANTTSGLSDDGVSPLALYGPLYPSYLLLGLRLLDRSFAKPSSLSLTILPRIKSLGYISRILGGSTQLYNELLRIYRFRHDDFRGMVELLQEMEHAAVEFDQDTLWIVRDLRKLQHIVARGEKGRTMQALWAMPEYAPSAFGTWLNKIGQSIREKEDKSKEKLQFPRLQ